MAKLSYIESDFMIEQARKTGISTDDYFMNYNRSLSFKDKRGRDKYGNILRDLLITRSDGSQFIIHEDKSETDNITGMEKYQKLIITDPNQCISTLVCYTHDLNFEKMQNDSYYGNAYLNAIADNLFSRERIQRKIQQRNDKRMGYDFIYVGTIMNENGHFRRKARSLDYGVIEQRIDMARSKEKQINETHRRKQKRVEMINAIHNRLNNLPTEQLEQMCNTLGISLDEIEKS